MFANTEFPSLSGTSTARDFVEFPSQFNEHWATYPAIFQHYAKHYKTGAPMPAELLAKIKKSDTFNKGYDITELLAAAELDMMWHALPASAPIEKPDAFETQALEQTHLADQLRAAALPFQLLRPHLEQRICRGLLCLSVDADAG